MKFKEKLTSRIKELRESRNMQQKELADILGVSRQTIYYLEKGTYTPKLTLSLKIARIFEKTMEEIFFLEPLVREVIGRITIDELERISKDIRVEKERIEALRTISNQELADQYSKEELIAISRALGCEFDSLFEE